MKGDAADAALWQSMAHNDGYAKGLAEGRKQGLEEAAKSVEPTIDAQGSSHIGRMLARRIRALKESK